MTDATSTPGAMPHAAPKSSLLTLDSRVRRRNAAEARFRAYGIAAVSVGLIFLVFLLIAIFRNGIPAFTQTFISVPVELVEEKLDKTGNRDIEEIKKVSTFGYKPLLVDGLTTMLADAGIENPFEKPADVEKLVSASAVGQIRDYVISHPDAIGKTVEFRVLASSRVDGYFKGRVTRESLVRDKNLDAEHLDISDALTESGQMKRSFNWAFIFGADASESRPEQAGIGVSMIGSFFMMLVVLFLSLPIGVAASIYLEEFAPKNKWTDLIEVNISNLAAVPSIVFGILGLAVFIQFVELPQSAPLFG